MPTLGASREADPDTYLHRIGRTGRFGRRGVAINLIQVIPPLRFEGIREGEARLVPPPPPPRFPSFLYSLVGKKCAKCDWRGIPRRTWGACPRCAIELRRYSGVHHVFYEERWWRFDIFPQRLGFHLQSTAGTSDVKRVARSKVTSRLASRIIVYLYHETAHCLPTPALTPNSSLPKDEDGYRVLENIDRHFSPEVSMVRHASPEVEALEKIIVEESKKRVVNRDSFQGPTGT